MGVLGVYLWLQGEEGGRRDRDKSLVHGAWMLRMALQVVTQDWVNFGMLN